MEKDKQLGDVLANVPTEMLKTIESLWVSLLFQANYSSIQGLKYASLGGLYIDRGVTKTTEALLHVYFYNSLGTATLEGKEILPSFLNYKLEVNENSVVAYGSSLSTVPEGGKVGQILKVSTPLGGSTKIKFYFPQGVGTGEINAMCISLVPLDNLKSLIRQNTIFAGKIFEHHGYEPATADKTFVPKVMLGTEVDSFGIGSKNSKLYTLYSIDSGSFTKKEISFARTPCWGLGCIVNGNYYFIDTSTKLCKYSIESGVITEGEFSSKLVKRGVLKIAGSYYVNSFGKQVGQDITLCKLDLANLSSTTETLSFTVPDFGIAGIWSLLQFENGDFGVHFAQNGLVFRFTDIEDPINSVSACYFSGITSDTPIPVEENGNLYFYGATNSGYYPSINSLWGGGGDYLHILTDAQISSPLLAYNKYNTSFSKTTETQLTTTTSISIP